MDAMSCLAPPPPTSFFPAAPPAYYSDAAMARALHYSMSDHYSPAASTSSPSSSSSLLADLPYSDGSNWFASAAPAPAPLTGLTCDSVLVASDAAPRPPSTPINTSTAAAATSNKRRLGLGPAAVACRAGKRRPRASKRAPTTYISTDPANFRLMVQHVTGIQAEPTTDDGTGIHMPASAAAAALLHCPTYSGSSFADALQLPSDADAATLHHRLQQQQPCFPTLDSWNVLYESAELF